MPYRAPVSEIVFCLEKIVGYDRVAATERFSEATPETVAAMLTEAGRICEEVLAPLNRAGDLHPARLENGIVRTSPGFGDGWRAIAEAGFVALAADPDNGGLGMPMALTSGVNEMIASACLALQLAPLMSQGQIEALEHHASDELKAIYLPKLISGDWNATMNLTEPQAGSDVGALRTRAEPNGDGTYAITGQKIYISWGDNDFTENTVHLVLARLPGAPEGTRGISLFLVPKRLPDAAGNAGVANALKVVSLEHKMGLHGSPTCVMQYDGATGWMVGAEGGGMAAMFTMMNNARLGVGVHAFAVGEAAYQHALDYAAGRVQGRPMVAGGTGTILDHADVRRMLTGMRAELFAARAMSLDLAVAIDMAHATGDAAWAARAAFLTPIVKTYGSETGISVADTGIQVHGGMGFIEETGAAQFARDVRVTAIYEGTTGIQGMDLVGRKFADGGDAAFAILDEVAGTAEVAGNATLAETAEAVRAATQRMLALDLNDRFAGAVPFARAFALTLGGHYHLRAAMAEPGGPRARLAQSYLARQMAAVPGLLSEATAGAGDLYALSPDDLAA
ncbi:acyl-CoA dehydrogenase [Roseibacterium sp. SDUM158016]|uniref:acyl-CoA dehydrogenase n=1 Tax=Roseicyclus sediminis TaxID=2980997 RepID=UPI0021D035B7|nr:acyl-CoA dehydrogenase [Roseibacterium sp. SDUM158016]MCU4651347.1 acyl-CoA dehydrogenase [Roseibacterium sp. SDUM158016]